MMELTAYVEMVIGEPLPEWQKELINRLGMEGFQRLAFDITTERSPRTVSGAEIEELYGMRPALLVVDESHGSTQKT